MWNCLLVLPTGRKSGSGLQIVHPAMRREWSCESEAVELIFFCVFGVPGPLAPLDPLGLPPMRSGWGWTLHGCPIPCSHSLY